MTACTRAVEKSRQRMYVPDLWPIPPSCALFQLPANAALASAHGARAGREGGCFRSTGLSAFGTQLAQHHSQLPPRMCIELSMLCQALLAAQPLLWPWLMLQSWGCCCLCCRWPDPWNWDPCDGESQSCAAASELSALVDIDVQAAEAYSVEVRQCAAPGI